MVEWSDDGEHRAARGGRRSARARARSGAPARAAALGLPFLSYPSPPPSRVGAQSLSSARARGLCAVVGDMPCEKSLAEAVAFSATVIWVM